MAVWLPDEVVAALAVAVAGTVAWRLITLRDPSSATSTVCYWLRRTVSVMPGLRGETRRFMARSSASVRP